MGFGNALSLTAKPCDSCKSAVAAVFCQADSAALCFSCDTKIHSSLTHPHGRVWMCEVCEHAPAAVTCKADAAALCVTCDADIHSANPLARRHERFPVEPFFEPVESMVARSAAFNFLPLPDEDTKVEGEEVWLLPDPNPKLIHGGGVASDVHKAASDVFPDFFNEIDPFLDFEYGTAVDHQFQGPGIDCIVPVQTAVQPPPVANHSPENVRFDFGFCGSINNSNELSNSSFSFELGHSLSHSISSSSLDVGVVPDHGNFNSLSDNSYPLLHASSAGSEPSLSNSATTSQSGPATQLYGMDREARVLRYREKRKNRKFEKTIRYASRKAYAETRPRIKGRFAKRTEVEVEDSICSSAQYYSVVPTF